MRGRLVIERATDQRWAYIEERCVRLTALDLGNKWILVTYSVHGEQSILPDRTTERGYLESGFQVADEIEVPEYIAEFGLANAFMTPELGPPVDLDEVIAESCIAKELHELLRTSGGLH